MWACCLVTYAVVKNHLSDQVALGVIGLVSVAIGFYQWSRSDDSNASEP